MCSHAKREAAAKVDEGDREYAKQQQNEQSPPYGSNEINKLNISENEDEQFMLEATKKMKLYTEGNENESKEGDRDVVIVTSKSK